LQLPDQDKYLVTKQQLKNELAVLMGGRTAEEMIFGEITTGASNDIERATSIAHKMVCTYGMSSLGNRTFGQKPQNVFLGRDLTQHSRDFGDHLADDIDKAMNAFIDEAHEQAKKILTKHEKKLHEIAKALLKEEVLDGELLKKLLGEKKKAKVKNRSQGGDASDNSMNVPPMLNPGASLA
jgi:cell division protease FtsH